MKYLISIIIVVNLLSYFPAFSSGVNSILINENFENVTLKEVLITFKIKYNLKIAFTERVVKGVVISTVIKNQNVQNAFKKILKNTRLTYELVEEDVIIIKKKKKKENKDQEKDAFDLTGVVQDVNTGERLPYAFVLVESMNRSIPVNTDGYFSLPNTSLPLSIKISYLGYQDTVVYIDESQENKRLQVNLIPLTKKLDEVVVSGKETNDFKLDDDLGKINFNPDIISQIPSTGEEDIFRSLQLLPGITGTGESSSGLNIQGGNANQNLVLFDGFTVYHMDHFFGYFSAFNPNAIKSVRLFKGGFDAKYGGRVSSIVDITGKEGNLNKTSGSLGFNMLSVNTSLEVPFTDSNSSLFFSGRRSYTDILSTTLFEKIYSNFSDLNDSSRPSPNSSALNSQNTTSDNDFYYSDLNVKFSTKVGPKNHISVSFYDTNDILNYDQKDEFDFRNNPQDITNINTRELGIVNWGNVGASVKWSRLWDNNHYSNMLLSYSRYQSSFTESATKQEVYRNDGDSIQILNTDQDNEMGDVSFKVDHEWTLPNSNLFQFGIATSFYTSKYKHDVEKDSQEFTIVDYEQNNKGLYSQYAQYVFHNIKNLAVTVGLRNNFFAPTKKIYIEPRASFIYTINENWFFKGAIGKYHQFINQTTTQNALEGSRDFWLLANDQGRTSPFQRTTSVPVQEANHFLVGLEYKKSGVLVNVNYYKKDFNGLIEYAFRHGPLLSQFRDPAKVFAQGTGVSEGVEVLVKRNSKRFNGWISYTYGKVKHQFDAINDGESFYADHDQRHELKLYASYNINKFNLYATWFYGSGKPYTNVESIETIEEGSGGVRVLNFSEKNGARLKPYNRLDLGASYNFDIGDIKAKLALSLFNVYDRKNIQDVKYDVIEYGKNNDRRFEIKPSEIKYLGFTPNISFKIDF